MSPNEDQMLDRITLEALLNQLPPADRAMMILVSQIDIDVGYDGPWPPTYEDIGAWVGRTFEGSPLAESTIRYRRDVVLSFWRGERTTLRRARRVDDQEAPTKRASGRRIKKQARKSSRNR
jgi:hypothetical protein